MILIDDHFHYRLVDENILIGVSNLINSSNWTGQLWYFSNQNDLKPGKISENVKCVEYPLSLGTAVGIFVDNDKVSIISREIAFKLLEILFLNLIFFFFFFFSSWWVMILA